MGTDWGAHGVVALPDRKNLAVCCHGEVYPAGANDPADWETIIGGIGTPPIVLEDLALVLFVYFTDIVAWGPTGHAWKTDRPGQLVYDDLKVEEIVRRHAPGHRVIASGNHPSVPSGLKHRPERGDPAG